MAFAAKSMARISSLLGRSINVRVLSNLFDSELELPAQTSLNPFWNNEIFMVILTKQEYEATAKQLTDLDLLNKVIGKPANSGSN